MGVLDDAIREHLELKRLHGASDEEIQKEEAEALGPARRDFPAPAEPAEEVAEADEVQSAEVEGAEPLPEPPAEPVAEEPTVIEEPPPAEEPEPDLDTRDSTPETEEKSDDDVLEETPEFLQDAPEHDRLWFEQKPPRDFDFE